MSIPSKILKIHDFLNSGLSDQYTIIDVRSPSEFAEDHVPGAVNAPVLNDEERAQVGTIHKQVSTFRAREEGARIISKNISSILEKISPLSQLKKPFLIYCWRGGMRSKSLFTVMEMIGYRTFLLEGGYKSYRKSIHRALEETEDSGQTMPEFDLFQKQFLSIHGYTGSGKSELIEKLKSSHAVIDLEKAAMHRGSLLGSYQYHPQPSQKMFETDLFFQFHLQPSMNYILEGESRKIGNLNIPSAVWKKMKEGKKLWVELPVSVRIQNSLEFYRNDTDQILKKLFLLEETLGRKRVAEIRELIELNHLEEAAEILLVEYYDPLYKKHSPESNPERYDKTIHADNAADLYEKVGQYLKEISF